MSLAASYYGNRLGLATVKRGSGRKSLWAHTFRMLLCKHHIKIDAYSKFSHIQTIYELIFDLPTLIFKLTSFPKLALLFVDTDTWSNMEPIDTTEIGQPHAGFRQQKRSMEEKLKDCVDFVKGNGFTIGEFFLEFIRSKEYSRENSRMCEAGWDHQILDEWWQTQGSQQTLPCIKGYTVTRAEEMYTNELTKIARDSTLQSSDQLVALVKSRLLEQEYLTRKY